MLAAPQDLLPAPANFCWEKGSSLGEMGAGKMLAGSGGFPSPSLHDGDGMS